MSCTLPTSAQGTDPFQKGFFIQKTIQKVMKVVSLVIMVEEDGDAPRHFKIPIRFISNPEVKLQGD